MVSLGDVLLDFVWRCTIHLSSAGLALAGRCARDAPPNVITAGVASEKATHVYLTACLLLLGGLQSPEEYMLILLRRLLSVRGPPARL